MKYEVSTRKKQKNNKVPEGAKILEQNKRVEVEEITNGYVICRSNEVKYEMNGMVDWAYLCSKKFSKINPVKVDKTALADKFD